MHASNKTISLAFFLVLFGAACAHQSAPRTPEMETLAGVCDSIAKQLGENYLKSAGSAQAGSRPLIFLNRDHFADTRTGNVFPFSAYLAKELEKALADTGVFSVTTDPYAVTELVAGGTYHRRKKELVINCSLHALKKEAYCVPVEVSAAAARETLHGRYWEKDWFAEDARGKILYLMSRLENTYCRKLGFDRRATVHIHPFPYQGAGLYSPFSDYLSQHVTGFLAQSNLLAPKTDAPLQLLRIRDAARRPVIATESTEATIAGLIEADCFLTGRYFFPTRKEIEIQAQLSTREGIVLAGDSVRFDRSLVHPDMLRQTQTTNADFMRAYNAFQAEDKTVSGFRVEVFTQHGRNNIKFYKGDQIVFFLKASHPAYIRLFDRNADGKILQIYPNAGDPGDHPIQANEVVSIPDQRNKSLFAFEVGEPFGDDLVKVFASDKPLPELPGRDTGFAGVRLIDLTADEIQKRYEEHASAHGIRLAQDVITIRTEDNKGLSAED